MKSLSRKKTIKLFLVMGGQGGGEEERIYLRFFGALTGERVYNLPKYA